MRNVSLFISPLKKYDQNFTEFIISIEYLQCSKHLDGLGLTF